jgi:hypothetical protein
MYHYERCSKVGGLRGRHCEECQRTFDAERHVCPHCWQPVTNKAYLAKDSVHQTGRCRSRNEIKIPERTSTKPRSYRWPIESFWRTSREASKGLTVSWPPPVTESPSDELMRQAIWERELAVERARMGVAA